MKKLALSVMSIVVVGGVMLFTGCTTEDTGAPSITLNGNETDVVVYKSASSYTDPGATATDAEDGDVTVTVTGTVNMSAAGDYILTYTATDKAGNTATKDRTVVVNAAPYLAGAYNAVDVSGGTTSPSFGENITASSIENNKILFDYFAYYVNGSVYGTISGSTITIPQQTVFCGDPATNRQFTGTASFTATTVTINYTEITNGTTATGVTTMTKR